MEEDLLRLKTAADGGKCVMQPRHQVTRLIKNWMLYCGAFNPIVKLFGQVSLERADVWTLRFLRGADQGQGEHGVKAGRLPCLEMGESKADDTCKLWGRSSTLYCW